MKRAQMVECLPSKCKALSSNPSTAKKKKKDLRCFLALHTVNKKIEKKLNKLPVPSILLVEITPYAYLPGDIFGLEMHCGLFFCMYNAMPTCVCTSL
jgi:hypothetical protein